MDNSQKTDLEQIYKTPYIDRPAPGYYPLVRAKKNKLSLPYITDLSIYFFKERLSIDTVIKELTFALVALATYLFMQYTGRLTSLKGFGTFIGAMLVFSLFYNLYKAAFKSLAPGLICICFGLSLLTTKLHQQFFIFLSKETIEYIIGGGAFFVALSLLKSEVY
ncbi:hypothetical protein Lnau_3121 [Legionella nautarum]|uniref:Transmembrane protein n=1 Tax=Legionella nautarum TaxID=45070 RepID=A0A0W0WIR3_9GAMM|nr:hypothetical protein [Legionella nautarum]KTD32210.1 hypothetical protein Lnau_3121 [Legionella nautarum]